MANIQRDKHKCESNKEVPEKIKKLTTLEKKGNLKKPQTERQKHKLLKLKMKRKAKKSAQKQMKNKESKTQQTSDNGSETTTLQTLEGASSNWQKFLETKVVGKSSTKKRKVSPERIRNPKYRKVIEGTSVCLPDKSTTKPEIWFDDVDEFLLEGKTGAPTTASPDNKEKANPLVKPEAFKGLTKAVAMDCEMVGVGDGSDNMVARVSIVNQHGEPIFDKYVKPKEKVIDYRTHVSGIRPGDMEKGEKLEKVQKDVADILNGRILVGHAIQNDLKVLFLQHPRKKIRDTSRYKVFRRLFEGRTPSLKNLSSTVLHVQVQEGEHNSVQDAQAAMRLYTMFRQQWESELKMKRIRGRGGLKTNT